MDLNRKKLPAQDRILEIIRLHGPLSPTTLWTQAKNIKITNDKLLKILTHLHNTARIEQGQDQHGPYFKAIT